ncbi:uncharacterized protein LOC100903503 [Galendromus occidentalis]|uniref:Uncharacterized protein LOC100903503 n=1 Tax=Galendromus occidentalis TaxID=34638 RepID=A0AAJ6QRF1_9ACAR|nr:uncharacterized protein LOC100903503 [Galendromus occidentalis]
MALGGSPQSRPNCAILTDLGSWIKTYNRSLHGFKSLARGLVEDRIADTSADRFPMEWEVACFVVPANSREENLFPGPRAYFLRTINSDSELLAFLETEIELLDFPVEPGYKIESWFHRLSGIDYRRRLREIEAEKRGLPRSRKIHPHSDFLSEPSFRERLDRRLRCLE